MHKLSEFNDGDYYDDSSDIVSVRCSTCKNFTEAEVRHGQIKDTTCDTCGEMIQMLEHKQWDNGMWKKYIIVNKMMLLTALRTGEN